MSKILVVALLCLTVLSFDARPPAPICRPSPLPSIIPVSIGQTMRVDLQNLFDGFNLSIDGVLKKDHIEVLPKYLINSTDFPHSFNFSSAKIKQHNRFLGLVINNQFSQLSIGTNHPQSGIIIQRTITVQDQPQLHCFDVQQVTDRISNKAYAIVDCGVMRMGELSRNEFIFIDLQTFQKIQSTRTSDVFVRFNHISKRNIQVIVDPFTRMQYILRVYTAQNVNSDQQGKTYIQIFMHVGSIMQIQILDIIDHTLLNLHEMAIMDYQIHFNFIYILVKNQGLYQIQMSPNQRITRHAYFPIKMNVNRFRIEQNGFNDDLHVVLSNDNTVYQYQWDVLNHPVLVTKYTLMAGSVVEQLLMDEQFVIVSAWAQVDQSRQRRTWVFTRRSLSYTHAFGSFVQSSYGPSIIIYHAWQQTIQLIQQYRSYNIKLSLPYLLNKPGDKKAGDTQSFTVKAVSMTQNSTVQCRQTFNFIYIDRNDRTIFKTGLQGRKQMYVDAPDDLSIDLQYEFFGRNISYNVTFTMENITNSTLVPQHYIEKKVKATINMPPEIDQSKVVFMQTFAQDSLQQLQDKNNIYGIIQVQQTANSFPFYYIHCTVQIDAQFVNPILRCRSISKTNLSRGRIMHMSQMFSTKQRIGAIVFQSQQTKVYLYYFYPTGFMFYGSKSFGFNYQDLMTSVQITAKKQLVVTYQYGKRIQVYNVQDIHHTAQKQANPIFTIDHRVMSFFGVDYWAPVNTKVSIYHDEVTFVKTKTGVMALNINQMGFPQLLFHIKTTISEYDFQINKDTLLIITTKQMQMYRLTRPLRRAHQPFLLQKFDSDFNLNQYDDLCSDGLFYLAQKQDTMMLVVHPNLPSTSVIYTQFYVGKILLMDAVRLNDKQVLFIWTGKEIVTYMFAQNPKLKVRWKPTQHNFTMNVSAYNEQKTSQQAYSTKVQIIQSNQATINTTDKFNQTQVRKLGHVSTTKNGKVDINITLNDTQWFTGNIMHYSIKCPDCNKNVSDKEFNIILQNHLKKLDTDIQVGQPVYDLHSTYAGIYGQMYNSIFKTFEHNDSVAQITKMPTFGFGQVCSKMAVQLSQQFVLSLCQSGGSVNVFITVNTGFKPFTYGPFQTDAEAVNHAELVGNILMIVDNDDDPFNRAGGVYLYYIDFSATDENQMFNMLDYLDYADVQIQGFYGTPHIASADIHKPLFNRQQYAVFLTEARTGNIFVFLFEVSANKQQAVYLTRRMINLQKLIPESAKHPTPLRVININIIDYTIKNFASQDSNARMQIQYILLLTVKNWHHIQLMLLFDEEYDLLQFQLTRVFQRVPYPWQLTNFVRLRKGSINASYFAVSYRNFEQGSQVVTVYELPYFQMMPGKNTHRGLAKVQGEEYLAEGVPKTRMLAAYRVRDTAQISFAFNIRDQHRLLFNDAGATSLSELELNKQLKLIIKNAQPSIIEKENITIIAENHYTNFSFIVEMSLTYNPDNEEKVEIIWIIILVIGFFMIVGLIFVWSKQNKTAERDSVYSENKQSLLTVEPQFKGNYINRTSVDPDSVRGTVDYSAPVVATTPVPKKMQKQTEAQQKKVQNADNPLEEKIAPPRAVSQESEVTL